MSETIPVGSVPEVAADSDSEIEELERLEKAELDAPSEAQSEDADASAEQEDEDRIPYEELKKRYEKLQGALGSERAQRKELSQFKREIDQRLNELQTKTPSAAAEKSAEKPDRASDPLAYLDWLDEKVSTYEQAENARTEQQKQQETTRKEILELSQYGAQSEAEFKEEQPDYDAAAQYYAQSRIAELERIYAIPTAQAQNVLQNELVTAMRQARQTGANPAQAIYEAAKLRGYSPKSDKAEKTLKQMGEGRKMSPSMPQGGKGKSAELTVEALMKLDGDEFTKAWEKAEKQGLFN